MEIEIDYITMSTDHHVAWANKEYAVCYKEIWYITQFIYLSCKVIAFVFHLSDHEITNTNAVESKFWYVKKLYIVVYKLVSLYIPYMNLQ